MATRLLCVYKRATRHYANMVVVCLQTSKQPLCQQGCYVYTNKQTATMPTWILCVYKQTNRHYAKRAGELFPLCACAPHIGLLGMTCQYTAASRRENRSVCCRRECPHLPLHKNPSNYYQVIDELTDPVLPGLFYIQPCDSFFDLLIPSSFSYKHFCN